MESLENIQGYLEVKSMKLLQTNKKYWFTLLTDKMEYHTNRLAMQQKLAPLGSILMKDVIDVRVASDQRNTFVLVRKENQGNLFLKVKKGNVHNWVGNIRGLMFRAREDPVQSEAPTLRSRRPRKKVERSRSGAGSLTRPQGDAMASSLMVNNKRISCSTNDLFQLLPVPLGQLRGEIEESLEPSSGLFPIMRPRGDSTSASSLVSGSSRSSVGRKKPRIPVSGFTSRAFLANEREMVDDPEVHTKEDFEFIVQAERHYGDNSIESEDFIVEDVIDGKFNGMNGTTQFDDENNQRNVTFSSKEEITVIEVVEQIRTEKKTKKKEKKKEKTVSENTCENVHAPSQKKYSVSIPGWMSLRRKKKKVLEDVKENNTHNHLNIKDVKDHENNNIVKEESPTQEILPDICNSASQSLRQKPQLKRQNSAPAPKIEPPALSNRHSRLMSESVVKRRQKTASPTVSSELAEQKRMRINSTGSGRSSESFEMSGDLRQKISNWKSNSVRNSRKGSPLVKLDISAPLKVDVETGNPLANDIHSQIDKIAQDRLEAVFHCLATECRVDQDNASTPPPLPPKPLDFHIRQLERVLEGQVAPSILTNQWTEEAMLQLGSLKVLRNMEEAERRGAMEEGEPLYDLPRVLEEEKQPLSLLDIHHQKRLNSRSVSDVDTTSERSWENSVSKLSLSSSVISVSTSAEMP